MKLGGQPLVEVGAEPYEEVLRYLGREKLTKENLALRIRQNMFAQSSRRINERAERYATILLEIREIRMQKGVSLPSACRIVGIGRTRLYGILEASGISKDEILPEDLSNVSLTSPKYHPMFCPYCGSNRVEKSNSKPDYVCEKCMRLFKVKYRGKLQ